MLVDVRRMRVCGEKLAQDQVLAQRAVRGVLGLSAVRPGWFPGKRNAPMLASLVHPDRFEEMLPALDEARITRVARGALLIVGVERIAVPVRAFNLYPQAWIARPVFEAPTTFICERCDEMIQRGEEPS